MVAPVGIVLKPRAMPFCRALLGEKGAHGQEAVNEMLRRREPIVVPLRSRPNNAKRGAKFLWSRL